MLRGSTTWASASKTFMPSRIAFSGWEPILPRRQRPGKGRCAAPDVSEFAEPMPTPVRQPAREAAAPAPERRRRTALALGVVWAGAAIFLSAIALDGWHPHDEGTLGQSAVRVLAGELPHRDFDAVYTGGLELLHALAMRCAGTSLASLRLVLLLAALAVVPVVFWLAARALAPLPAALATAAALVWSLPAYFASLPSWYVTFLGLCSAAAVLRYADVRRRRWAALAGACGALALLMKVVGVFVI